jgi:hypothetical protein
MRRAICVVQRKYERWRRYWNVRSRESRRIRVQPRIERGWEGS